LREGPGVVGVEAGVLHQCHPDCAFGVSVGGDGKCDAARRARRQTSLRQRVGANGVPSLHDWATELFDDPDAFDGTGFDGVDALVAGGIVVRRIDHDGVSGQARQHRSEPGYAIERDGEDEDLDVADGVLRGDGPGAGR
jgi:hypothetical protein